MHTLYISNKIFANYYCALIDEDLHTILTSFYRLMSLEFFGSQLVSMPGSIKKLSNLCFLSVACSENLEEISEIPFEISRIDAAGCTSLTSQSANVLWSQVSFFLPFFLYSIHLMSAPMHI